MDPDSPSYGTSVGSCGYGMLSKGDWPYWNVAALPTSNVFFNSLPVEGCGSCFEIRCLDRHPYAGRCNSDPNQRSILVQITDQCPECGADHIDMQARVFEKIAPPSGGRISLQYRRVECKPPGKVVLRLDNFNVGSWMRFSLMNVAGLGIIRNVWLAGSDRADWQPIENKWGAAWEAGQTPQPPLRFKFEDESGAALETPALLDSDDGTGDFTAGVQFSLSGTDGTATSTASLSGTDGTATSTASLPSGGPPAGSGPEVATSGSPVGTSGAFGSSGFVTRLDEVFGKRSSGPVDPGATVEALRVKLEEGKQELSVDSAFAESAVSRLNSFLDQCNTGSVIKLEALFRDAASDAAAGEVLLDYKQTLASSLRTSKHDPALSQAPDTAETTTDGTGSAKIPIAPVFSYPNSASPGADDFELSGSIDLAGGVQVRGFAGPSLRGYTAGEHDVRLVGSVETKPGPLPAAPAAPPRPAAAAGPLALNVLSDRGHSAFLRLVDRSPDFKALLSQPRDGSSFLGESGAPPPGLSRGPGAVVAERPAPAPHQPRDSPRSAPPAGLTLLVPPESAVEALSEDVTSSRRALEAFLFRHLLPEPLTLAKMRALGGVSTAEAAEVRVEGCDGCGAGATVGGWRVAEPDVECATGLLHFLEADA